MAATKESNGWRAVVRFTCDKKKLTVPLSHIKGFKRSEFIKNMKASVFWGPNVTDSPRKTFFQHGKVLEVETLPEIRGTDNKPIAGYYKAEILELLEPLQVNDEKSTAGKVRCRSLSEKGAEFAEQERAKTAKRKANKNAPKADETASTSNHREAYVSKEKRKKTVKKSESKTVAHWEKKYGTKDSSSSSESDLISDDELVQKKVFKQKMEALTQENKRLKKDIQRLFTLNLEWQKKFLSPENEANQAGFCGNREAVKKSLFPNKVEDSSSISLPKITPPNSPEKCSEKKKTPKSVEKFNETLSEEQVNDSSSSVTEYIASPRRTPQKHQSENNLEENGNTTPLRKLPKVNLHLTPKKLEKVTKGVKHKDKGDSIYARNLAMAIFGEKLLKGSTTKGKKHFKDPSDAARPPLPEKGLAYLTELFKDRMKKEEPPPSDVEIMVRCDKINSTLGHLIKYLRNKDKKSPTV